MKSNTTAKIFICVVFLVITPTMQADIKLPPVFSDHMVLQQKMKLPIWGWSSPGDEVTVQFAGQTKTATGRAGSGEWRVNLDPLDAAGVTDAQELVISSKSGERKVLRDILVGEVWFCSGQSNMEWPLRKTSNSAQEIATANCPQLRLHRVGKGSWQASSPKTAADFSAVAYFFGRSLNETRKVPVGLIDASVGGSSTEAWISSETLGADKQVGAIVNMRRQFYAQVAHRAHVAADKWKKAAEEARQAGHQSPSEPRGPRRIKPAGFELPSVYWSKVRSVLPIAISGVIWYQGEANAHDIAMARQQRVLLPALIRDWRAAWGQGDFPFIYVQLPNYSATLAEPGAWTEMRQSQAAALDQPQTAMVVTIDVGDVWRIHPPNKKPVGYRMALCARGLAYGEDVEYRSPVYESMKVEGGAIRIRFSNISSGFAQMDQGFFRPLRGFAIAGEDRKFVRADAQSDGNTIIVSSPHVPDPIAVRYAWSDAPIAGLRTSDGLPVAPFRTDSWPHFENDESTD